MVPTQLLNCFCYDVVSIVWNVTFFFGGGDNNFTLFSVNRFTLLQIFSNLMYDSISDRWPNFLCVCSVFSSGSVQLNWSQWPPSQNGAASKWFPTAKGLLGAGPSGIMAADVIITDSGAMHVAGVPIVNPSTVVVWEVTPGPGNGFQAAPKATTSNGVPPSLSPPKWAGFAPLAAYLFSWQEYLLSEAKQGRKLTDQNFSDAITLHCSPVSNFSAYVSPEAAAQSAATTTWGSGVTAVAFDPTRGGSVIAVVIVEGIICSHFRI